MTVASAPARIPDSHRDLLERPICGVLTTLQSDGQPHAALVWLDAEDDTIRVNTTLERGSGRNLLRNPKASILVVDPEDTSRFLQVRGDAELVQVGVLEHLDALTRDYTTYPSFYGHVYPIGQQALETRVICRIKPVRISVDAIHR
jgi:PPOX class probable F420-dependent enzyme